MIKLYRLLTFVLLPIALIFIIIRILKGKENLNRIGERFGYTKVVRDHGKYIWLHSASVGESLVALTLSNHLKQLYPKHKFLITSGTIASSKILASKASDRIVHQFIPIDEYFCLKRFFEFWKPSLGIFIESEIWPNLISISSNYCPIILTNAIMSDRSLNRWLKFKNFASYLLGLFDVIICQSKQDSAKYSKLCNKHIEYNSNLKFASPKPYVNTEELYRLKQNLNDRLVLLAASTHRGEEDIICRISRVLKTEFPNLLTIIAPRHIERADDIEKLISSNNFTLARRSKNDEITSKTEMYLADSLGELGLFFSIANVSFIGGSFKIGGHNILEPAYFDTNIVVGPDMRNSLEITNEFLDASAIMQATDENDLMNKIRICLKNPSSKIMIEKARQILLGKRKVIHYYTEKIMHYLDSE